MSALLLLALLFLDHSAGALVDENQPVQTRVFSIASGQPSGNPRNDRVWITLFEPAGVFGRRPAVVLLHPLGEWRNTLMLDFGRYLAARGMRAVVVELPYHMHRLGRHDNPLKHYVSSDIGRVHQAFSQAAADASAVVDWLISQPGVDPARIGIIGVSLGAIVAHTAMGRDPRFSAGVAILGGGDFRALYHRSILFRLLHPDVTRSLTEDEIRRLREIDPLTYADRNRPRHVLMIEAARDDIIPPAEAVKLWKALGRPPIYWLDTNHYGPIFAIDAIRDDTIRYLRDQWGMPSAPLQRILVPTLKLSLVSGLDVTASIGVEMQLISFLQRRNHMSLLHFDAGADDRGPYLGFAGTVNQYLDVGYGRRLGRASWRPYFSLHLAL